MKTKKSFEDAGGLHARSPGSGSLHAIQRPAGTVSDRESLETVSDELDSFLEQLEEH